MYKMMVAMAVIFVGSMSAVANDGIVSFDGDVMNSVSVVDAIKNANIDQNDTLSHQLIVPEPVVGQKVGQEEVLYRLSGADRALLIDQLRSNTRYLEMSELLKQDSVSVFLGNAELTLASTKDNATYYVVGSISNPEVVSAVSRGGKAENTQSKSYITMCRNVLEWVVLIKEGVEVGKWVARKICEEYNGREKLDRVLG